MSATLGEYVNPQELIRTLTNTIAYALSLRLTEECRKQQNLDDLTTHKTITITFSRNLFQSIVQEVANHVARELAELPLEDF
jgi:phage terminase Nu1 subunit (DNA packaging protein)